MSWKLLQDGYNLCSLTWNIFQENRKDIPACAYAHSSSHLRLCLFVCQDLAIFLLIFVEVVLYTFLIYDIRRRLQHTLLIISPILRANFVGERMLKTSKYVPFVIIFCKSFTKNSHQKLFASFLFLACLEVNFVCLRALLSTLIQGSWKWIIIFEPNCSLKFLMGILFPLCW